MTGSPGIFRILARRLRRPGRVGCWRPRGSAVAAAAAALVATTAIAGDHGGVARTSVLYDISGVVALGGDLFVAVHDGKADEHEKHRPRVSLLMPGGDAPPPPRFARNAADGVHFRNLEVAWPSGIPHDLESIARIPGTRRLLLAESGDDCGPFQRIFLVAMGDGDELAVEQVVRWPTGSTGACAGIFNVEASAVFRLGEELFFVYAERAEGQPATELRWARMDLAPIRFDSFSSVRYAAPTSGDRVRPIVALDVDDEGHVFAAAAYDSGDDDGPFRSWVSRIGRFFRTPEGGAGFTPSPGFENLGQEQGSKIEGIAVRRSERGGRELFVGTDDENRGAALHRIGTIR